jgi:flavin-binding protein dodecin
MSVAKVVEILAEGSSIEAAIEDCAKEAGKSVKNIKSIYVQDIQATVKNGKVTKYRVACKVTFIVG